MFRSFLLVVASLLLAGMGRAQGTIKSKVVDAEEHSVTETISDSKGKIIKKTRFFFDQNNWSRGAIHFTPQDEVKYKEVFKRDAGGKITEARLFDKDDKSLGRRIYHYDSGGKLLRIDDYDANGTQLTPARRAEAVTRKKR